MSIIIKNAMNKLIADSRPQKENRKCHPFTIQEGAQHEEAIQEQ